MATQGLLLRKPFNGIVDKNLSTPLTSRDINSCNDIVNVMPNMEARKGTSLVSKDPTIWFTQHVSIKQLDAGVSTFVLNVGVFKDGQPEINVSHNFDFPTIKTALNGTSLTIVSKYSMGVWDLNDNTYTDLFFKESIERGNIPPYYYVPVQRAYAKADLSAADQNLVRKEDADFSGVAEYDATGISAVIDGGANLKQWALYLPLSVAYHLQEGSYITLMKDSLPFGFYQIQYMKEDADGYKLYVQISSEQEITMDGIFFNGIRFHSIPDAIIAIQGRIVACVNGTLCSSEVGSDKNYREPVVYASSTFTLPEHIPATSAFSLVYENFVETGQTILSELDGGLVIQTPLRSYIVGSENPWSYAGGISSRQVGVKVYTGILIGSESFIVPPTRTSIVSIKWRSSSENTIATPLGYDYQNIFSSGIKDMAIFRDSQLFVLMDDGTCILLSANPSGLCAFRLTFGDSVERIVPLLGDILMYVSRNGTTYIERFSNNTSSYKDQGEYDYTSSIEFTKMRALATGVTVPSTFTLVWKIQGTMGKVFVRHLKNDNGEIIKTQEMAQTTNGVFPEFACETQRARIEWSGAGNFGGLETQRNG